MIWLKFVLLLIIILLAGTKLARYGDIIAEKTRLGRIWIGLVLIAVVTTMPELTTAVSSAALIRSPDLALGTLLGSCCFNILILALLDILHSRTPVLTVASSRHIITAGWGALFIAIAGGSIIAGDRLSSLTLGRVGIPSIVILLLYLLGVWWMFRHERSHPPATTPVTSSGYDKFTTKTVSIRFVLAAAAVIVAGVLLSHVGNEISETTGWDSTFVGTMFLAIATSAPEIVVSITALRLGAIDLAVAGLLGANILNIAIILPVDIAQGQGFILSTVSTDQLVVASVALVMSLLVMAGLRFRQRRKTFIIISWYASALIVLYIFGAYVLFTSGIGA